MQRILVDGAHIAVLHRLSAVHDHDVLGDLRHNAEVMRDENDGCAHLFLQLLQQAHNLRLNRHVQRGRWFVRNQDFRVARQRHGNHNALAHTAGELVWIIVDDVFRLRDADKPQHFDGLFEHFCLAHLLMEAERFANLLSDGKDGVQAGHWLLENHRDVIAADAAHFALRLFHQVLTVVDDFAVDNFAGRRGNQAQDGQRGHRLAAAAFADDGKRFARLNLEIQSVHCGDDALFGIIVGFQTFDLQYGFRHQDDLLIILFLNENGKGASSWRRRI